MPRRRNSKSSLINKQISLVTSRLMQISLKLDDYIYKDIPISVNNALKFIKEVSGYKDKCYEDKRSLQVIEKLIRVMKGIIAEQQESRSGGNEIHDVKQVDIETTNAFTIDEDLTQFTQDIDIDKIIETQKNDIQIVELCIDGSDINEDMTPFDGQKEKLNLTKKGVNLERALSELTINVNDDDTLSLTQFNPDECSQSVLINFDCINSVVDCKKAKTNVTECSQDFKEAIQSATIRKRRVNKRVDTKFDVVTRNTLNSVNVNSENKLNLNTNTKIVEAKVKTKGPKATQTRGNTKKMNKMNSNLFKLSASKPQNDNITAKEKLKIKRVSKVLKNKEASRKSNKQSKPKVVEQYKPITDCEKMNNISDKIYNNDLEQKLDVTVQQTNRRLNENHLKTADKRNTSQSVFTEEPVKTIYSKEVEYDLSWVEGIRFVREISQEECIPAYFEDGFWDDFTLPNNWNDEDFFYK